MFKKNSIYKFIVKVKDIETVLTVRMIKDYGMYFEVEDMYGEEIGYNKDCIIHQRKLKGQWEDYRQERKNGPK